MLKEKVDSLKQSLIKVDNGGKKSIENLVSIGIILVITVIAINFIWNGNKKSEKNNNQVVSGINIENDKSVQQGDDLEQKLTNILSHISGVGDVKVLLTYAKTNSVNPIYNEDAQESVTEETDTSGR